METRHFWLDGGDRLIADVLPASEMNGSVALIERRARASLPSGFLDPAWRIF